MLITSFTVTNCAGWTKSEVNNDLDGQMKSFVGPNDVKYEIKIRKDFPGEEAILDKLK